MTKLSVFLITVLSSLISVAQDPSANLLQDGLKLSQQKRYDEAFRVFEKVNKMRGQKCSACFYNMALMKYRLNDEGGAKKYASKAIEVAQTPEERAAAYGMKGEVFLGYAENNKKEAAIAEESYRAALKEAPDYALLHCRIGTCLVHEERLDDAKKEFQAYLDLVPDSKDALLVRRWIENPIRAMYTTAPAFEFISLKGENISLAQLTGKVVVLDFWGTWCPPCRASVPELKELVKKYPADKLVVISVSSDTDQGKWMKFIEENKMDWVQYRDSDHRIQSAYRVNSYPTYVVIDKDGSIRERISGKDPTVSLKGRISDMLKKIL